MSDPKEVIDLLYRPAVSCRPAYTPCGVCIHATAAITRKDNLPPIIKIVKSYWTFFLMAYFASLVLAGIVIGMLPKSAEIHSTVALATTYYDGRDKVIDPPDKVAKVAIEIYLPTALFGSDASKWDKAKIPPRLKADVYDNGISLSDRAAVDAEAAHIDLQQRILDQIIAQQKTLTDRTRKLLRLNVKSAQRTISNLEDQEKLLQSQIRQLDKRSEAQGEATSNLQGALDAKTDKRLSGEAIQYLQDRLWSEEDAAREIDITRSEIAKDLADVSRQKEDQAKSVAFNNLQLDSIKDAHVIFSPVAISLTNSSRKILFLMATLIGSLFFAILVVLTLDRIGYKPRA